ncbi:MAG: SRPBCC domain-containing protein [Planctomycetota bacterium]
MRRRLTATALLLGLSACATAPESTTPAAMGEAPAATTPSVAAASPQNAAVEKVDVTTLEFETEIARPVAQVWDAMFSRDGYTQWTAPFMAGSYFEGSWAEGERIHFLAPGGSGMVAEIAANRPHEFLSIKHLGYVVNGVEDLTSEGVRSWAPAYENYRFRSVPGGTVVMVEHEVMTSVEGYMGAVWPKALAALKSMCEAQ